MTTLAANRHDIGYQHDNFAEMYAAFTGPEGVAAGIAPVDRETFNYGRALPLESLSPAALAEYKAMVRYRDALSTIANVLTNEAWRLEMAVRDVRIACEPAEREAALAEMRRVFHSVDRSTERMECQPLRFYRFGRIGNVLRHFFPL